MFDDPRAAEREFFPPSSFAHRWDVVERTGVWRDPNELRAPADCEFLLRAARLGCSFVSTRTITVHKFAAGHRYLSYRLPSGLEQERMLDRLSAPGGEMQVREEIRKEIADGADHPPILYPDFDRFSAGELYRTNRRTKGLENPLPIVVDKPLWLEVEGFAAGLDWYALEKHPLYGAFRWSGPNPNPLHLVNVRVASEFLLRIRVLAFAADDLSGLLELDVNDRPVAFVRERNAAGAHILTVGPLAGPVGDGLVLRFRLPHCARLPNDPHRRRAGLALSAVEVVPLA
jgi:hypothetical protein